MDVFVPRDRAGSFTPVVAPKSARRTSGIDEMVISLVGKGLTTGEVAGCLREVFGVETSKETVSAITDRVLDGMAEWRSRPSGRVCPVLIIDAIHVKIRDGQVANRPVYVAIAVDVNGLSRSVVFELLRAGRLRSVKEGRARLIPASAIRDYIALLERETQATK